MDACKVKYPIGDQDFKSIREEGFVYVDKTRFIATILEGNKYIFLARPRRFGKSLFLSMLDYFFRGERELFKGLYIDSTDWKWEPYPVLHLDLNTDKYAGKGKLNEVLDNIFRNWEEEYDVDVKDTEYSQRFKTIIESAYRKTGKQVVILVDEYDKPLVGNLHQDETFEHYRKNLASLYSNFKSSAKYIRLVFLTGVSRFSKLSVFSDLNNLNDISFDDEYADICGITEQELLDNFRIGIKTLAEEYEVSYDEACHLLKQNYDGYRFAKKGSEIYNPWSVLNCLAKKDIRNYWTATGATTVIAESLRNADIDIEQTLNASWKFDDLAGLDLLNADPTALLYQTGYLTIDSYDRKRNTVKLKVPNDEVKNGLFKDLLQCYIKVKSGTVKSVLDGICRSIEDGAPEEFMKYLGEYFSSVPYDLRMDNENNFHNAFYILMTLIGIDTEAEVHTSNGRIDLLIENSSYIYLIELKYDSTPAEALRQIEEKQYARQFQSDPRKLFKIGINFSSKTRRPKSWEIV